MLVKNFYEGVWFMYFLGDFKIQCTIKVISILFHSFVIVYVLIEIGEYEVKIWNDIMCNASLIP